MCPVVLILLFLYVHRAGELSAAELENLMVIVGNPRQFKIPDWFLNRKKDHKDGRYSQVVSNALDMKLRDDLERLKKIRSVFTLGISIDESIAKFMYFYTCTIDYHFLLD